MEQENEVKVLTPYEILQLTLGDLYQRYDEETNEEKKKGLLQQILQTSDRISKMDEQIVAQNKNELDNETKLEMNRLDNETKLKICQLDNETRLKQSQIQDKVESTRMAIQAATSLTDIARATVEGIGRIALVGTAFNMETEGYTPGRSTSYRLASDLGRSLSRITK